MGAQQCYGEFRVYRMLQQERIPFCSSYYFEYGFAKHNSCVSSSATSDLIACLFITRGGLVILRLAQVNGDIFISSAFVVRLCQQWIQSAQAHSKLENSAVFCSLQQSLVVRSRWFDLLNPVAIDPWVKTGSLELTVAKNGVFGAHGG
jgi:hypothetical protein